MQPPVKAKMSNSFIPPDVANVARTTLPMGSLLPSAAEAEIETLKLLPAYEPIESEDSWQVPPVDSD